MKKTALVTGANRGIGLEICRQLLAEDINILLCARSMEKAEKAKAKLEASIENKTDVSIECMVLDVTCEDDLNKLKAQLDAQQIQVDILVNNAGISQGIRYNVLDEPMELTEQTMNINFWGSMKLSQIVVPHMIANNYGRVVNISSGHGSFSKIDKQNPGYRLSKVAMNALTVMLADQVAEHNILVNAMTPGWVRTRLGGLNAQRSVAEGADTAVWLCLLEDDGPNGEFFKDKEHFPW